MSQQVCPRPLTPWPPSTCPSPSLTSPMRSIWSPSILWTGDQHWTGPACLISARHDLRAQRFVLDPALPVDAVSRLDSCLTPSSSFLHHRKNTAAPDAQGGESFYIWKGMAIIQLISSTTSSIIGMKRRLALSLSLSLSLSPSLILRTTCEQFIRIEVTRASHGREISRSTAGSESSTVGQQTADSSQFEVACS